MKRRSGRTAPLSPAPLPRSQLARLSRLLPGALIVIGTVFQLVTPAQLTGTPFFVAAPLLAAPLFTRWRTVGIGALTLGVALFLQMVAGGKWASVAVQHLAVELATIAFATTIAVLLNTVVSRGREQLATSRDVAEAAQRAVLPAPGAYLGGLRVAACYQAADREALIGGDLYAAHDTPHGVRLVMGDVRGKGIMAIETVSVVLGAFREAADQHESLFEVAKRMERALARENESLTSPESSEAFVTCVLVEIPSGHEVLHVLNYGHPAPLLLGPDGSVTVLTPRAFHLPLGLSDLDPGHLRSDTWDFPADAALLLFTDGLSEARDSSGTFYDPARYLKGRRFPAPDLLLSALAADVRRYADGRTGDDMALLAAHRPRSRPAP